MASSASTSTASIEPAVHTNSTGGNMDKCSAAASRALTNPTVNIIKMSNGVVKTTHGGHWFTRSTYGCNGATFICDLPECSAALKTHRIDGQYHVKYAQPHDEELHMQGFRRPPGGGARTPSIPREGGKRKAASCADKPMATVNGDAQLPAKKSTGHRLPVGGAFMFKPSARPHSQGAQPKNSDDAARDKRSIKSAKGSGAGNLVGAAADRPSPVHVQHPGSSNEPGTSAWPSGEQGVQDSESLLPPTPPLRADHANQLQYDADNGNHSDLILIDDSSDGDIEENPGAAKREAGDVNSWDAKEGGSFKKVHKDLDLLHEKVDVLHQKVDALEEKVHAAPPAASLAHPVLRKLPMKTAEEFEAVETLLADENSFKLMVSHLKSFDGSTLEEKADGMMTRLFSLELAATYNYNKGSKGKLVFKGTLAEKAVRRAAMESFPGLEPKEYTSHLRKRFRKAYDHLKKQEDAIESAKGSGAGNLVDNRAAAVQHSPVHSQHPRGSNEPGTSASPSGDHEAKESKILPPPTPPGRANHGITVKNPKSHKSMNRDIKEKSGAVKQEADDVNSRDVKAGGKGSLDPPLRIASYESMRNGWNAADDSAGIALSMQGLGRTQIILNMNLETGDLCDKNLRESLLRLLQAEQDFVVQQQKSEALRIELLSKELYSNMTDNKI